LVVLAVLAAVGGALGLPEVFHAPHFLKGFLNPVFAGAQHAGEVAAAEHHVDAAVELGLMGFASLLAIIAIGYAYMKYVSGKALPAKEGEESGLGKIVYHKYYVDEIYNLLVVKPVLVCSVFFHDIIDRTIVDGAVNWSGKFSIIVGSQVRKLQSGYIGFYLLAMVISIVAMFAWVFLVH
jgi:NADH-quinone oxidoreductase subunit L